MNIGDRIKVIRKTLNLSQDKFGNSIGVTKAAISTYEIGIRNPTDRIIKSICNEHKVNYTYIITGEGEIFRSTTRSILDDLVVEYRLDSIEQNLLFEYLQLSISDRRTITNYIKKVIDSHNNYKI